MLVEGAGSASEVNLRANDIANMGFARAADVPVVLIGDIDRGGVIASLVGTKAVIDPDDAALVRGFLVNKFRGDPALFADGNDADRAATPAGRRSGLVPFFPEARLLPAEDALGLDRAPAPKPGARLRIAVPILPHIANFDDLDPLDAEPAVDLVRLRPGAALPGDADLVILPGSKATIADLAALREAGFDDRHRRASAPRRPGARPVRRLPDARPRASPTPAASRGRPARSKGSACSTSRRCSPPTSGSSRRMAKPGERRSRGYEMHMGTTTGPDCARPFGRLADGSPEGAVSADGRVTGTYVHGLFADDRQRSAWLARLGAAPSTIAHDALIEATLDRLAAHLAAHIDLDRLLSLSR